MWLEKTRFAKIVLKKRDSKRFGASINDILVLEYKHRFKESYVWQTLEKFRRIIAEKRDQPYVHLTLTCYRSFEIPQAIEALKRGWNNLRAFFTKRHGKLEYLAVLEPHDDGFPHL
ncbi:hypothetical protein GWN91_02990, partial [Candidatus Saccharibacteria bacterium]|nr:hypothetical protein [Candidatus Saccharibacteria bacterium]